MAAYLADLQEQESVRIPVLLYPVRFLVQVSGVAVFFVFFFFEVVSFYNVFFSHLTLPPSFFVFSILFFLLRALINQLTFHGRHV